MVKKIAYDYQCEECGLHYKNKNFAVKCEDYCKKYKACSLEITKRAINLK